MVSSNIALTMPTLAVNDFQSCREIPKSYLHLFKVSLSNSLNRPGGENLCVLLWSCADCVILLSQHARIKGGAAEREARSSFAQ
jgi:hypothetical protein